MTGELGKSVAMVWAVNKLLPTDKIQSALLVMGNTTLGDTLFQGVDPINDINAKKIYNGRLNATWDGESYTLTLSQLTYADVVAFTLVVSQIAVDNVTPRGDTMFKTITITEVTGMYKFFL